MLTSLDMLVLRPTGASKLLVGIFLLFFPDFFVIFFLSFDEG